MEQKLRNSEKRRAILNILKETKSHPTADWVYDRLKEEYPDAGIATVYRNLKILLDQHEIMKINVGDGLDHYDADISEHYHFMCRDCRRIFDIEPQQLNIGIIPGNIDGMSVEGYSIMLSGLCSKCCKKKTNKSV